MFWYPWRRAGHRRMWELLSPYLDGEVSPRGRERVEQHLATCEACRQELEELRATVNLVQALPQVAPPRAFTLAEAPSRGFRLPALPWGGPLATATAVMLFTLLVLGDLGGLIGPVSVVPERAVLTVPVEPEAAEAGAPTQEGAVEPQEEAEDVSVPTAAVAAVAEEGVQRRPVSAPQPTSTTAAVQEAELAAPTSTSAPQVAKEQPAPTPTVAAVAAVEPAPLATPSAEEEEAVAVLPLEETSAPSAVPAPGEPLLEVPLLLWLQGVVGILAVGLGTLWLLRRRGVFR